MLVVSFRRVEEEVRSVEACEYAEAETDRVEKGLVNQGRKLGEDRFGKAEAHFEIDVVRSEIEEVHSGIEGRRFGIEGDHPGMVEVHSETGEVRSGKAVRMLGHRVDLGIAEVVQMLGYAYQVVRSQAVAAEIALVEVEQMAMAVAGTEVPVGHKIAGTMSKSNY